ncbi:ABC transporter ATP-binding protein [Microbulbifer thermotolerans]|uniref:ABC transporter ATP-binding protein n=1 Tax=Microbulbifer thermotolerans TaxID=252514 RepID=UPI0008F32A82|nr:ABC transporter ATP-binding protein [Microbulbifer thermotolerans]MCX2779653.1 ABC transporter ATP-binding protein [Microbulbifer thermotolerans]MCX2782619.1 ABC transporter ATP-binding protein [Microbulbifer thermotolerans]MCX2804916.1 ABC transporter ATP-binding protein [Microbulbifer thermotolerans]MCX2841897.1 ABC transporter ATP-binding protein [Microbulbifer thermotolerans]SFB95297.1 ABC-2 type transport system ATP-binding protein [Microbulbifer thermotolerans]
MTAALSIRNLEKTYDNGFRALKGISFEVQPGDFFALLGPNGAGKSTTIGIICSLVRKTGGQVSIFGIDIDRDFPAAKRLLGVVPQEFNFSQFEKVYDIVCTQGGFYGMPRKLAAARTEKYLKQLDLWDKRGVQARMLSGGMKRRLMIARALIHEPELLILDEPTAGVDIELRRSMWTFLEEINRQGTTIILTTHYLEEAESLCRNIAIIDKGDIVENTSIKSLLKTLNRETFILDSAESLSKCPELGKFEGRLIDENSLEVTIEKGQSLNALFATLEEQGVAITSMRNRANRLEELFVSLLAEGKQVEDNK